MAGNKFASMVHRNSSKLTLILVYAVLEWVLIALLLVDGLFSYLIRKFAAFFGLKPPCLWCSRVDHVLEPNKDKHYYRELVCDNHAKEISRLGYCLNHAKLAEACEMCEECSLSRPSQSKPEGWVACVSLLRSSSNKLKIENGVEEVRCSCCEVNLEDGFYSKFFWRNKLFSTPSWEVFDYPQKATVIEDGECTREEVNSSEPIVDISKGPIDCSDVHGDQAVGIEVSDSYIDKDFVCEDNGGAFTETVSEEMEGADSVSEEADAEDGVAENGLIKAQPGLSMDSGTVSDTCFSFADGKHIDDEASRIVSMSLDHSGDHDRLLPVDLIDSLTAKNQRPLKLISEIEDMKMGSGPLILEEAKVDDEQGEKLVAESLVHDQSGTVTSKEELKEENELISSFGQREELIIHEKIEPVIPVEEPGEMDMKAAADDDRGCSSVLQAEENHGILEREIDDCEEPVKENCETIEAEDQSLSSPVERIPDLPQVFEPVGAEQCSERIEEVQNSDLPQVFEPVVAERCSERVEEVQSSVLSDDDRDQGANQMRKTTAEGDSCSESLPINETDKPTEKPRERMKQLSVYVEFNEGEEDKAPETPCSIEGIHSLHKRLLFERKESGTESLDGSIISEIEGGEGSVIERFKSALKSERRALSALYTELEEERSASAIAANQTMAMITRLQEEKAQMQMEALQYQRMMEEQSEYDQEALQLLNELMVKREKEKQELERELEVYRKKVRRYEAKERKMREKRSVENGGMGRNGVSSASSSTEDSDTLSLDLNEGDEGFYGIQESNQNTPADAILSLGKGQLETDIKSLTTLDESLAEFEEERISILEQLKTLEEKLFTLGDDRDCITEETIGNGKHVCARRNMGSKAKRLLPLFDAMSGENLEQEAREAEVYDHGGLIMHSGSGFDCEKNQLDIEEEVEHVYERLQALEADREFLKHCIGSLNKGDKGMDLLQEILQHLRDLRNVELRARSFGDVIV
ncbi:hypothetical protein AMTRI_Chr04g248510 [Amborella trichopoda]